MTVVFCGCAAVYAVCARISARERQEARAERAPQLRQQRLQLQQRLDQQRWLEHAGMLLGWERSSLRFTPAPVAKP